MMLRGATSTCLATHGRGCLGQGRPGHCGGGRAVSRFRNRRLRASSETVIVHELFGGKRIYICQTKLYTVSFDECWNQNRKIGNWNSQSWEKVSDCTHSLRVDKRCRAWEKQLPKPTVAGQDGVSWQRMLEILALTAQEHSKMMWIDNSFSPCLVISAQSDDKENITVVFGHRVTLVIANLTVVQTQKSLSDTIFDRFYCPLLYRKTWHQ